MALQQLIYLLFTLLISITSSSIVPLTGDDWKITDWGNNTALGHVPGTIHTILFAAKMIPDPYIGENDINLRPLILSNWTFMKQFNLSTDFLKSSQITIYLKQIDTIADITINNCSIGRTSSMFLPYKFHIPGSCLTMANQIRIDFESPILYAKDQALAYNESVPPDCPPKIQNGECYVQFIRKEPCSFSWGWGPAFAPIGITGDIYLEGEDMSQVTIRLESVNVASFDITKNNWRIDVMLSSDNDQFESNLKFLLDNTKWSYETSVLFNRSLSISIFVPDENILRWWPNGYGNQTLYKLIVLNDGILIDSCTIGFRTVELIQKEYEGGINGTSFYFAINNRPIFIKGSNWIPPDSFQERVTEENLERLLYSAQLANMNMLRVWGGGIYERDSFYNMADRFGIMLWHDFMFACSLYPVNEEFLREVHDEILYQVKRLQSHPSIVLWSGNNENEQAIAENWYNVSIDKMNKTKDNYRKLYVDTIMQALHEVDKGTNRPFVTSSPSNGLETISEHYIAANPQDPLYGDVHFYKYQEDPWNPSTYPISRFISETGVQSLPSLSTWLQATTNQSDLALNSTFMTSRQHHENQTEMMIKWIECNLPFPVTNDSLKTFSQLIYLTQINQAMTLKSISDFCRLYSSVDMIDDPQTSQGNTMGLMYWQINDIWQSPSWATIDYELMWKMGHYFVRHMYSPVHPIVILTPYLANMTDEKAQVSLYVINDQFNVIQGDFICSVYTLYSFTSILSFGSEIALAAPGLQHITDVSYIPLMKRASCTNTLQ